LKSVIVVKFVVRNGVYFSRMYSPISRSAQFCSVHFKVSYVIFDVNRRLAWQLTEICIGIGLKMTSVLFVSFWQ